MLKMFVGVLTFAMPVTVTILDTFGYIAKVEGASMQPVLNPLGQESSDYVFLNKWQAKDYNFRHGEIVALMSPANPDHKLIKRIIALEGDKLRMLHDKDRYVEVPKGHCWVEGDHHQQSMDSNFFGPVSLGLITAKASHIIWPPKRWQKLKLIYPDPQRL